MGTNMNTEIFFYPSYLDPNRNLEIKKTTTKNNIDIITLDRSYDSLYDEFPYKDNVNILDFLAVSEFDMSCYTRYALNHLPKKENIVVGYTSEALNSTYWNVVFDILQNEGYKNILWIDGGVTPGTLLRHLYNLKVTHFQSPMFYKTLFRQGVEENIPKPGMFTPRTKYFVSLARLARQERIYFTNKLLNDRDLHNKGIVTCGWGDSDAHIWDPNNHNRQHLKLLLTDVELSRFPIGLGHKDSEQHQFYDIFNCALFNVVQESSIGADVRSSDHQYSTLSPLWQTVSSDRIFFTEKSAKAFLMNQIPIFIAAPGMVQALRNLGFDVFDDIVDHNYDKEDNIVKRCDMVFAELKRLVSMHTLDAWNTLIIKRELSRRFFNNATTVRNLGNTDKIIEFFNTKF